MIPTSSLIRYDFGVFLPTRLIGYNGRCPYYRLTRLARPRIDRAVRPHDAIDFIGCLIVGYRESNMRTASAGKAVDNCTGPSYNVPGHSILS